MRRKIAFGDSRWFPRPTDLTAAELLEAMEKDACPICTLRQRSEERFLFSLFWEGVNDPFVRVRFRKSLGFCTYHTRQLRITAGQPWAGALGMAILYRDLIDTLLARMHRPSREIARPLRSGPALSRIAPTGVCWLCEEVKETERTHLQVLARGIEESSWFRGHYSQSHGLCMPHSHQAMRMVRTAEGKGILATHLTLAQGLLSDLANCSDWTRFLCGSSWAPETPSRADGLASLCPGCAAEASQEQGLLQNVSFQSIAKMGHELCARHWGKACQALLSSPHLDPPQAQRLFQSALSRFGTEQTALNCPYCQQMQSVAGDALMQSGEQVGQSACLPHLRLVLCGVPVSESLAWLEQLQLRLKQLGQELDELIRKHDYRFSSEPLGAEQDSWLRAIAFFAGARCME